MHLVMMIRDYRRPSRKTQLEAGQRRHAEIEPTVVDNAVWHLGRKRDKFFREHLRYLLKGEFVRRSTVDGRL